MEPAVLKIESGAYVEDSGQHIGEIQLETVGAYLRKDDITKLRSYIKNTQEEHASQSSLEKLLRLYPETGTNLEAFKERDYLRPQLYSRLLPPFEIRRGDLCGNGEYYVRIPKDVYTKNIAKTILAGKRPGLDFLTEAVSMVYNKIQHATGYFYKDEGAATIFQTYKGKIIDLERVVSGDLPAVCFEKALFLASILSVDRRIKRAGIRVYLAMGGTAKDNNSGTSVGYHAWVRIDVPDGFDKRILAHRSYVLDPTKDKIYILDTDDTAGERLCRYEEEIAPGQLYSRSLSGRLGKPANAIYRRKSVH